MDVTDIAILIAGVSAVWNIGHSIWVMRDKQQDRRTQNERYGEEVRFRKKMTSSYIREAILEAQKQARPIQGTVELVEPPEVIEVTGLVPPEKEENDHARETMPDSGPIKMREMPVLPDSLKDARVEDLLKDGLKKGGDDMIVWAASGVMKDPFRYGKGVVAQASAIIEAYVAGEDSPVSMEEMGWGLTLMMRHWENALTLVSGEPLALVSGEPLNLVGPEQVEDPPAEDAG